MTLYKQRRFLPSGKTCLALGCAACCADAACMSQSTCCLLSLISASSGRSHQPSLLAWLCHAAWCGQACRSITFRRDDRSRLSSWHHYLSSFYTTQPPHAVSYCIWHAIASIYACCAAWLAPCHSCRYFSPTLAHTAPPPPCSIVPPVACTTCLGGGGGGKAGGRRQQMHKAARTADDVNVTRRSRGLPRAHMGDILSYSWFVRLFHISAISSAGRR